MASIRRRVQRAGLISMIVVGTRAMITKKNDCEDNENGTTITLKPNNDYEDNEGTRVIDCDDNEGTGAGGRKKHQYCEDEMWR